MHEKLTKLHPYRYKANCPTDTVLGSMGWNPLHCSLRLPSLNRRTCPQRRRGDLQIEAVERSISRYMLLPPIIARSCTSHAAIGGGQGIKIDRSEWSASGKSHPSPTSAKGFEQVNGLPPALLRESTCEDSTVSGESKAEAKNDSNLTPVSTETDRVKELIAGLDSINQRINNTTRRPEKTHGLDSISLAYPGGYGTIFEWAPFPPGFGFYAVSEEAYSMANEPELCKLYTAILSLEGAETQGHLLSFLDDCRQQRLIGQALDEERSALLQTVSEWMANTKGFLDSDMADAISGTEDALLAEDEVRKLCAKSMRSIYTLFGSTTVMKIMETMEPPPEEISSGLNLRTCPLTKDIASVLDLYRSKLSLVGSNQKLDQFESLLKQLSRDDNQREYELEFFAKTIMNRQNQLQFVKDECKQIEAALVVSRQLLQRVEREAAQKEKAAHKEKKAKIQGTVTKKKVSCLMRKDASAQTYSKSNWDAKSAPLTSHRSDASSNRSLNASGCQRLDADLNQNMRSQRKADLSAPKKDEKGLKLAPKRTPTLDGTEEGREEDPDRLLLMINQFVALLKSKGCTLTDILKVARHVAEQEAALVSEKQDKIATLRSRCQSLMALLEKQSKMVPMMESKDTVSLIHNCSSPSHTCLFCSCHKYDDTTALAAHESVRTSCSRLLMEIKSQYKEAHKLLSHSESMIASSSETIFPENTFIGPQLACDELTSSSKNKKNLDGKADNPFKALGIAKDLVSTMGLMSKQLLEVICKVRERHAVRQEQNDSLILLQADVDRIESTLASTALAVARLRSGEDYLSISRTLSNLRCPYCQCYNAAGLDPSWAEGGELSKEAFLRVLSCVKQGNRSVLLYARPKEVEQRALVSGVEPEVLRLLEDATSSVFQLLGQVVHQSPLADRNSQTRL